MGSLASLLSSRSRTVWLVNINFFRARARQNATRRLRLFGRSMGDEQVLPRFDRTLVLQGTAFRDSFAVKRRT